MGAYYSYYFPIRIITPKCVWVCSLIVIVKHMIPAMHLPHCCEYTEKTHFTQMHQITLTIVTGTIAKIRR